MRRWRCLQVIIVPVYSDSETPPCFEIVILSVFEGSRGQFQ